MNRKGHNNEYLYKKIFLHFLMENSSDPLYSNNYSKNYKSAYIIHKLMLQDITHLHIKCNCNN